jgi:16S rRNA pseudouridine516 synthase
MRLDKYLAQMGCGTRTEVKDKIRAGAVTVNGVVCKKPESKVNENTDQITCQGVSISYQANVYYLFYKPSGCVTATTDRMHKTVLDYFTDVKRTDLFPVGRLDLDTEGLLLITNDGELAHNLLSPTKHVPKTYYAVIDGAVTEDDVNRFKNGVDIGEKHLTRPAKLEILASGARSEIFVTITEGKFHQVKRMFHAVGKEVLSLKRISMGSLSLPDDMKAGEYRELTLEEVELLKNDALNTTGGIE